MEVTIWKKFNYLFFVICLFTTISLSSYSLYRYLKNEDLTVVKVSKFLSSQDAMYPAFSFCIRPPFLKDKFAAYGDDKINIESYSSFLKGDLWDNRFLKIDYDNVTVSLTDNLIKAFYGTHSLKKKYWNLDHFVSFRSSYRKCFTINAPLLETKFCLSFYRAYQKIQHQKL